jgi:hypothetical protein
MSALVMRAIPQVTASDASVTERSRINPAPVGGKCQQSATSFAAGWTGD